MDSFYLWTTIVVQFFIILLLACHAYWQVKKNDRDPLTGLYNRRALRRHLKKLGRSDHTFSILMIDIDHFKLINDELGHVVGDKVIRCVARRISGFVRPSDLCFRYGGEEFLVIFPDTELDEAVNVATRLQEKLRRGYRLTNSVLGENMLNATVSMGLSFRSELGESPEDVLDGADGCLYKAKGLGRDNLFFQLSEIKINRQEDRK